MPFPIGRIGSIVSPLMNQIKGVRNPLAVLDIPNDGSDFGALTYPHNLEQQSGHFIMFHIVETTPGSGQIETANDQASEAIKTMPVVPFRGRFTSLSGTGARGRRFDSTPISGSAIHDIAGRGAKRIADTRSTLQSAGASASALTDLSILQQKPIRTETKSTVVIYMPEKISTGYSMEYQGESLRIAAAGAQLFTLTQDVLSDATTLTEAAKSDLVKSLGEEFGTRFGTQLLDQLGSLVGANVGSRAFLEKNIRRVVNPHMQFLFRSVNQRQFEYTFQFVPQSSEESEIVDNIIRTFKYFSHPTLVNTSGRLNGFPAEFDIQYISRELKPSGERGPGGSAYHFQENDWLNRIGRCYLSDMTVDYSAAGVYATHRHHASSVPNLFGEGETSATANTRSGNPPTHITMNLTFKELETLNREHILEGF